MTHGKSNIAWTFDHCELARVIDGDTIEAVIDLGFRIKIKEVFRLARIDCPEVRGEQREAGLSATQWVKDKIALCGLDRIVSYKHGKYRWVVEVLLLDGTNLSDEIVKAGHAIYREF